MRDFGYDTPSARSHPQSVGVRYRSALKLLTMANTKTPKGEHEGWLTATLYLQPHTAGGATTLCPYSTPTCREMCLAGAGLSGLPKQLAAKQRRTDLWHNDRLAFLQALYDDIERLSWIARDHGLRPALRLNGTSDILWERELPWLKREGSVMDVQCYDYTKVPLHLRRQTPGYHLTYSVGSAEDMPRAVEYLRAGQSIAVVVPDAVKFYLAAQEIDVGPRVAPFIDGDANDLRFLDPPSSIVLLRPKGHVRTDLMRPDILAELERACGQVRG
jgi:hypothetical protein